MIKLEYNRHPVSLREGKVFIDGVEVMDCVNAVITWIWETWSGKQLGDITNTNRSLGHTVKVKVTQRRSGAWMMDAIKNFKETRRTPEFTIQGVTTDVASDYYRKHGSTTVTAVGCVPIGEMNLTEFDAKGDVLEDTLEFVAADVMAK